MRRVSRQRPFKLSGFAFNFTLLWSFVLVIVFFYLALSSASFLSKYVLHLTFYLLFCRVVLIITSYLASSLGHSLKLHININPPLRCFLLPSSGGSQFVVHSVWESRKISTSPRAIFAPASLALMSPERLGRCSTRTLGRWASKYSSSLVFRNSGMKGEI